MKVLIIILMFINTIYAIYNIAINGKCAKVHNVEVKQQLTWYSCIYIATIAVFFDYMCVKLLICGV